MLDNLYTPTHLIIFMPVLFLLLAIYALPTIVAALRSHRNLVPIALVNFLLGWSAIGWLAALIWACTSPQAIIIRNPESAG